jgi:hypothetical protein
MYPLRALCRSVCMYIYVHYTVPKDGVSYLIARIHQYIRCVYIDKIIDVDWETRDWRENEIWSHCYLIDRPKIIHIARSRYACFSMICAERYI